MKKLLLFAIFLCINTLADYTGGPELYIDVKDNESTTWYISAEKVGNTPVFGEEYEFTTIFNEASDQFVTTSNIWTQSEGFDWIADPQATDNSANDDLGYGLYKIIVARDSGGQDPEIVIQFYYDTRTARTRFVGGNSPDIRVRILRNTDGTFTIDHSFDPGEQYETLAENDLLEVWTENQLTADFSALTKT